MSDKKVWVGR